MKVLMVCLGNICRSPMAEGVLRDLALRSGLSLQVDSAGTADYHVGEAPDKRAIACMREYNIDISGLRGRQFSIDDFQNFDHILVMDQSNLKNVLALVKQDEHRKKVKLVLEYSAEHTVKEVPDPWYGDISDFHRVYNLLDEALRNFLASSHRIH